MESGTLVRLSQNKLDDIFRVHPSDNEWWYVNMDLFDGEREFAVTTAFMRHVPRRTIGDRIIFRKQKSIAIHPVSFLDMRSGSFESSVDVQVSERRESAASQEKRISHQSSFLELLSPGSAVLKLCFLDKDLRADITFVSDVIDHGRGGKIQMGVKGESTYMSIPRLKILGTITDGGLTRHVEGAGWLDYQRGDWDGRGLRWQWMAVNLDDGMDLMVYQFLKRNGTFGHTETTVVFPDGEIMRNVGVKITNTRFWTNPDSGLTYPVCVHLDIDTPEPVELIMQSRFDEQEVRSEYTDYYEGACRVWGKRGGRDVRGRGFLETVGRNV